MSDLHEWPLILRTGYGNIFKNGRWTHEAIALVAEAINEGSESRWDAVKRWAIGNMGGWDELTAC